MIWIQDKEKQIVYPAKIIAKKTFNEFEMCDANQINCLEYLFDPNSIQRNVGGSDNVTFEAFFNKGATCVINGLSPDFRIMTRYGQTVLKYNHPLYKAIEILDKLTDCKKSYELLTIFNQFVVSDTERELDEFKKAKKVIESLSKSSVDTETFKTSVQMMWPVFGYFATEIFGDIEFIQVENLPVYPYDEINETKENLAFCNNRGIEITFQQKEIFNQIIRTEQNAINNSEVLSLAGKVYKRSR